MANMKEQIKAPEKELSNKERCRVHHIGIRMLTEMIEYDCKIKEEVKAIQNEIKENI